MKKLILSHKSVLYPEKPVINFPKLVKPYPVLLLNIVQNSRGF